MKFLVETAGPFQLVTEDTNDLIRHDGATVIRPSSFAQSRALAGQVNILEKLSDDATDEEWLGYVKDCDGDFKLARASFAENFAPEPGDQAVPRWPSAAIPTTTGEVGGVPTATGGEARQIPSGETPAQTAPQAVAVAPAKAKGK